MRPFFNTASILTLGLLGLTACSRQTPVESAATVTASRSSDREVVVAPEATSGAADDKACAMRTIYFPFDDDRLDEDARATIAEAVACLNRRGAPARLSLTGATDPRGTEEYNLALGERRARAVQHYLDALGIGTERVSVQSVGEEKAEGTDESTWEKDRHVVADLQ